MGFKLSEGPSSQENEKNLALAFNVLLNFLKSNLLI